MMEEALRRSARRPRSRVASSDPVVASNAISGAASSGVFMQILRWSEMPHW
jgi:hypothetical protein